MHLNVLRPSNAVALAFKEPNVLLAIGIIILSGLVSSFSAMLLGIQAAPISLIANNEIAVFRRIVFFIVALAIISLLLKRELGNIAGLVSSLALLFVVNAVGTVVFVFGVLLFVSGSVLQAILAGPQQGITTAQYIASIQAIGGVNYLGLLVPLVIGLLLIFLNLVLLYQTTKNYLSVSSIASGIIAIIALFLLVVFAI